MHRKILITIPQLLIIIVAGILLTTITVLAASGTTDAPNAPASTSSYTLEDIYQRLLNGSAGSQSTYNEPSVAPGTGTMHDLNDIMSAAPAADNSNGATAAQVLENRTFWGLTNGEWGLQSGTVPNGSDVSGANGLLTFNIPDGYYDGRKATASDSDLVADNIMTGNNIFGVEGEVYGGCTCDGSMVGTRWCDNGDGTVTDMLGHNGNGVCLVWLKYTNCLGEKPWVGDDNAHLAAGFLHNGDCGLTDSSEYGEWRLPTQDEFVNITKGTDPITLSSMQAFENVMSDPYWTRSAGSSAGTKAQTMNFNINSPGSSPKTTGLLVWPVRNNFGN